MVWSWWRHFANTSFDFRFYPYKIRYITVLPPPSYLTAHRLDPGCLLLAIQIEPGASNWEKLTSVGTPRRWFAARDGSPTLLSMVWMIEPEERNGEALAKPTEASALTAQPLLEWMLSQVFGERGADEDVQDGTSRPSPRCLWFLSLCYLAGSYCFSAPELGTRLGAVNGFLHGSRHLFSHKARCFAVGDLHCVALYLFQISDEPPLLDAL
jgi:hypothetical protein